MHRAAAVLAVLAALLAVGLPAAAEVEITAAPPSAAELAQAWQETQAELAQSSGEAAALRAAPAEANPILEARRQLAMATAEFRFREAARVEQAIIYRATADPEVQGALEARMAPAQQAALRGVITGLRSLWRAAGIDDPSQVRIRHNRSFPTTSTASELRSYYRASAAGSGLDWTYLAAINYVESDFGRSIGPSSAGAMGPMQFMPATWAEYGGGGDILSPHDSIEAAAHFLRAMGGPSSMDRAIYRYNNDRDYVASIQGFAAALRADPSLFDRMFYWSTAG